MSTPWLTDLKTVMRLKNTAYDSEISDLVSAALADLQLSGVSVEKISDQSDPLVKRAVFTYVKAHFGWGNADADRLLRVYDMLKSHLTLSQDYTTSSEVV